MLEKAGVTVHWQENNLHCSKNGKSISYVLADHQFNVEGYKGSALLPIDYIYTVPKKVMALICNKLQLNKKIFARECEIKKVNKNIANEFLDEFHLMNSTSSAFNYGIYSKDELLAVASFSKGRKMNRLASHRRSFELIRFCTKSGITVVGGLSKLLRHFCKEKHAGDIMTYVDKQFSDGISFTRAGFIKHSETSPSYFLIDKRTFQRIYWDKEKAFDANQFYLTQNSGNIKFVFNPGE